MADRDESALTPDVAEELVDEELDTDPLTHVDEFEAPTEAEVALAEEHDVDHYEGDDAATHGHSPEFQRLTKPHHEE